MLISHDRLEARPSTRRLHGPSMNDFVVAATSDDLSSMRRLGRSA